MTEQEEELKMKKVHAGYLRAASVSVTAAAVVWPAVLPGEETHRAGEKPAENRQRFWWRLQPAWNMLLRRS